MSFLEWMLLYLVGMCGGVLIGILLADKAHAQRSSELVELRDSNQAQINALMELNLALDDKEREISLLRQDLSDARCLAVELANALEKAAKKGFIPLWDFVGWEIRSECNGVFFHLIEHSPRGDIHHTLTAAQFEKFIQERRNVQSL